MLFEPHPREQHRGARRGAERDPGTVQRRQQHLRDEVDRQHRPVGADRDIGQQHQIVGVAQVLDHRDRANVEVAADEHVVETVGGVLGEFDVEQGPATDETPVDRQAVQELDVTHAGAADRHRSDATPQSPDLRT